MSDTSWQESIYGVTETPAKKAEREAAEAEAEAKANKNKDEDNKDDNVDIVANLWEDDDTSSEDDNNQNNNQNNNQQQQQQQDTKTPAEIMADRIKAMELTKGFDLEAIKTGAVDGNFVPLEEQLEKVAGNLYVKVLSDANQLIKHATDKAVTEAVSKANANNSAGDAIRQMNTAIPATTDAFIAPIATATLQRALQKGKSTTEAIEIVKQGLNKIRKQDAGQLGIQEAPDTREGNRRFKRSQDRVSTQNEQGKDDLDFLEILSVSS